MRPMHPLLDQAGITMSEGDQVDGTVLIGGYGVPTDPMDLLQCDSCQ